MAALTLAMRFLVLFLVVRAAWILWEAWRENRRRVTRHHMPEPEDTLRFDTSMRDVEDATFEEVEEP